MRRRGPKGKGTRLLDGSPWIRRVGKRNHRVAETPLSLIVMAKVAAAATTTGCDAVSELYTQQRQQ